MAERLTVAEPGKMARPRRRPANASCVDQRPARPALAGYIEAFREARTSRSLRLARRRARVSGRPHAVSAAKSSQKAGIGTPPRPPNGVVAQILAASSFSIRASVRPIPARRQARFGHVGRLRDEQVSISSCSTQLVVGAIRAVHVGGLAASSSHRAHLAAAALDRRHGAAGVAAPTCRECGLVSVRGAEPVRRRSTASRSRPRPVIWRSRTRRARSLDHPVSGRAARAQLIAMMTAATTMATDIRDPRRSATECRCSPGAGSRASPASGSTACAQVLRIPSGCGAHPRSEHARRGLRLRSSDRSSRADDSGKLPRSRISRSLSTARRS